MELETININQIHPADYNPRQISSEEYNKLTQSIKEYGLVDPIIINLNNNTIIGGHQRYTVLKEENQKTQEYNTLLLLKKGDIGWVFTDKQLTLPDKEHEKGLNLALNKINGEWEYTKLNTLIDELLEDTTFDINLTGFSDLDVETLQNNLDDMEFEEEETIQTPPPSSTSSNNNERLGILIDCKTEDELKNLHDRLILEGYTVKVQ